MDTLPQLMPEIDPNFEPQSRARSNTWPLRPREVVKEEDNSRSPQNVVQQVDGGHPAATPLDTPTKSETLGVKQKTSSRRNAWGNLSYADLITKAIESAPDKRLTLSQIYDWMVQNVPYFKDKGDSNSSAGWKNSIRHNLSLHSRFMRIQNEGTGKSSWWVINPDAKPGKTPRRRAHSMIDQKAFEKKRGKAKKRVEQLRAAQGLTAASPGSNPEFCEELEGFNTLSPQQDFRCRTSSNASSIGRLSPIQSAFEPDLHDNQVPPMSPLPWANQMQYNNTDGFGLETSLSESLADMLVGDTLSPDSQARSTLSTPSPLQPPQLSPNNSAFLPAPPPYMEVQPPMQPQAQLASSDGVCNQMGSGLSSGILTTLNGGSFSGLSDISLGVEDMDQSISSQGSFTPQTLSDLLQQPDNPPVSKENGFRPGMTQFNLETNSALNSGNQSLGRLVSQQQQQQPQRSAPLNNSLLRKALTKPNAQDMTLNQIIYGPPQNSNIPFNQPNLSPPTPQARQLLQLQQMSGGTVMQQQPTYPQAQIHAGTMGSRPNSNVSRVGILPRDLDLVSISENSTSDLECDVEQIIKHELTFDDNLDFSFDMTGNQQSSGGSGPGPLQT